MVQMEVSEVSSSETGTIVTIHGVIVGEVSPVKSSKK